MSPRSEPRSDATVLARIGKPHGLRGEVTVQLHTDDPEDRLADGAVLHTDAAPGSGVPKTLTVASTRVHRGIWLVAFEEIPDRTGAESLRNTRLVLTDADARPDAPATGDADEDVFDEADLVGLAVVEADGSRVGTLTGLELGSAQDRLVIELPDGRSFRLPFVRALVPSVERDAGRIVVSVPPGLIEFAE